MTIDVKTILDELQIPYKTHGRNIGRGYVGLKCPFCGDDPSEHLGVHLRTGGYHCWRDDRHSGGKLYYLLRAFEIPTQKINDVLGRYDDSVDEAPERVEKPTFSGWEKLEPATEPRHLRYLENRNFSDPVAAVRIGDIRFSDVEAARWRILFPMVSNRGVEGWTGRSIHKDLKPRYLTDCTVAERCVVGNVNAPTLFLVEGPIDALKINCAIHESNLLNVAAFAVHGKAISKEQCKFLLRVRPKKIVVCADNDYENSWAYSTYLNSDIRLFTTVDFAEVPSGYEDIGEVPVQKVARWLKEQEDVS